MLVERREQAIAIWIGSTGHGRNPIVNERRQPSCDGTSRINREVHVRICERLGVKCPGPTRQKRRFECASTVSAIASLIGHSGSSAFRPTTTTAVSMSLTGSCFSSESAPGPSIMGVEDEAEQSTERPCCNERQVQAIGRTHLIHRPARDIIPPQGGARVSSYRM